MQFMPFARSKFNVSARRVAWHRRLGVAGFFLLSCMPIIGALTATAAVAHNRVPSGSGLARRCLLDTALLAKVRLMMMQSRNEKTKSSEGVSAGAKMTNRKRIAVVRSITTFLIGMALTGPARSIAQPAPVTSGGQIRSYYVAADEVEWDYAPQGLDKMMGMKFGGWGETFTKSGPHSIGAGRSHELCRSCRGSRRLRSRTTAIRSPACAFHH